MKPITALGISMRNEEEVLAAIQGLEERIRPTICDTGRCLDDGIVMTREGRINEADLKLVHDLGATAVHFLRMCRELTT